MSPTAPPSSRFRSAMNCFVNPSRAERGRSSQPTLNSPRSADAPLDANILSSRSDALKVAVGFSPRNSPPHAPRRVATVEVHLLSHASLCAARPERRTPMRRESTTRNAPDRSPALRHDLHASLRDAGSSSAGPWAEAHGYHHGLATRGNGDRSFSANCST